MTNKEYRQAEGISRSELFKITESPEKFKYYKDNPQPATPALIFGQAFHKMALEPKDFWSEFSVFPECDRRTTSGKETYKKFLDESEGKTIISDTDYKTIVGMCDSIKNHPIAPLLLDGEHEQSYFWTDEMTGELCKCRTDCRRVTGDIDIIVDLKSATKAATDDFMRDSIKYGYDFQSAMYNEGVKANTGKLSSFVFLVVEKIPPYSINIVQADKLFMQRGYNIFRELLGIYHDCKQTGNWYGYLGKFNMINNLSLPSWLAKEME